MKLLFSFCLIGSLTIFSCSWAETNFCNPGKGPEVLYRKHVYRQAFKNFAQDVYVAYPEDSNSDYIDIVDFCVFHHDPSHGTKAVYAYSVEEDMDRHIDKATIILRGKESHAINSTVEFYGFRRNKVGKLNI